MPSCTCKVKRVSLQAHPHLLGDSVQVSAKAISQRWNSILDYRHVINKFAKYFVNTPMRISSTFPPIRPDIFLSNGKFQLSKDNITSPASISGSTALLSEFLFPSAGQQTQSISVQSLGGGSNPTVFDHYLKKDLF